jgi:hypothetical protein
MNKTTRQDTYQAVIGRKICKIKGTHKTYKSGQSYQNHNEMWCSRCGKYIGIIDDAEYQRQQRKQKLKRIIYE